jgi:hypothetical protein
MPELTEIQALAGICAAIDSAMRADPARQAAVTSVLGLDEVPGYRPPRRRRRGEPSPELAGLPSVDEALTHLTTTSLDLDSAASTVLAVAGLVKAMPDRARDGSRHDLVARVLERGELKPRAPDADVPMGVDRLRRRVDAVRVVNRLGLDVDAVATFKTSFMCRGFTLDDVKLVLSPRNWTCSDHWEEMTPVNRAGGRLHYRERVALAHGVDALTVEACLEFVQSEEPGRVAVLDYKRCDVDEHHKDTGVLVDEGWLVAEPVDGGVRITTSKRVQFADETIDGLSLVMIGCGLGYGRVAREFIEACLRCKKAEPRWNPLEVL